MPSSVPAFRFRRFAGDFRYSQALAPLLERALSNPCASAAFAEGARPCTNATLGADSLLNHVHELFFA
jgi:hypothetical protein